MRCGKSFSRLHHPLPLYVSSYLGYSSLGDVTLIATTDRDDTSAQKVIAFAAYFDSFQRDQLSHTLLERFPDLPWEDIHPLLYEALHICVRDFLNPPQLPDSNDVSIESAIGTSQLSLQQAVPRSLHPSGSEEATPLEMGPTSHTTLFGIPEVNESNQPPFPEILSPGHDHQLSEWWGEMDQLGLEFVEASPRLGQEAAA